MYRLILVGALFSACLGEVVVERDAIVSPPDNDEIFAMKVPMKREAVISEPPQDDPIAIKVPVKREISEPEQDDQVAVKIPMRKKRGIALHPWQWPTHLWPNAEVPYDIADHYTGREKDVILSAMQAFHNVTCIRFRKRTYADKYYLQISKLYKLERCFSYIGRQTSRWLFGTSSGAVETRMKLDPTCLLYNGKGTVIHELMHILGFYHEHQRDDRNPLIFGSRNHYNFKIYPRAKSYYMGAYDENSIMHYNFRAIAYQSRSYFSPSDIYHINSLYKCNNRVNHSPRITTTPQPITYKRPMEIYEKKEIESNGIFRTRRVA